MKKLTRVTLCLCLVVLAIGVPHVLSDDTEEQEAEQESVVQEAQETQEPEGEAANEGETEGANEDEETDTNRNEESDGSDPSLMLVPGMVNILLAPTACKPGYRVDHKGKCRPSL
uniref:Uncharacterized protein n=1 Tax=Anopheles dirus TaxID=7168 RepID=A0A182MZ54_9DIPT